jgi:hypothetical protein
MKKDCQIYGNHSKPIYSLRSKRQIENLFNLKRKKTLNIPSIERERDSQVHRTLNKFNLMKSTSGLIIIKPSKLKDRARQGGMYL